MKKIRAHSEDEKGIAMLEFVVILPLLLGLSIAALELSRSLRHAQLASTLSREVASIAYRECTNLPPPETMSCLEQIATPLTDFAQRLIPNSLVIVSVYALDDSSGVEVLQRRGIFPLQASDGTVGVSQTKNSITNGVAMDGVQGSQQGTTFSGVVEEEWVREHRMVVIGEAYVPFVPVLPFAGGLFVTGDLEFYDASAV